MVTFCLLGFIVCVVVVVGITTYLAYLSNCIRICSREQDRVECRIKMLERAMNNNNRSRKGK